MPREGGDHREMDTDSTEGTDGEEVSEDGSTPPLEQHCPRVTVGRC